MFGYYADLEEIVEDRRENDPTDTVESSNETPSDIDLA